MPKRWNMLENNPQVMNHLAYSLGLSQKLAFYDIYSFTDQDLLAFIPRPVYALLVIIPLTPKWDEERNKEDKDKPDYAGKGAEEPVIWFKQIIGNACGSYGLVHCVLNSPEAAQLIQPDSTLDRIRKEALDKTIWDRAKVLEDSDAFEQAHFEAVKLSETTVPSVAEDKEGGHFVAFVKAKDGHLWELEGGRKGPLDRGEMGEGEDLLSESVVERALGGVMRILAEEGGDLRFSAIALADNLE